MKWFENFIGSNKETLSTICLVIIIASCLAIIYAIVAGIWGYAPSHNFNWKVFGTGVVVGIINLIGLALLEE